MWGSKIVVFKRFVDLRNLEFRKPRVRGIWHSRNMALEEYGTREIWHSRNMRLQEYEARRIWSLRKVGFKKAEYRKLGSRQTRVAAIVVQPKKTRSHT